MLDPRFISSFENVPTDNSFIIVGDIKNIIVPTSIKNKRVKFIIEDAVLYDSSSSFFSSPVKTGMKTVDIAPSISIEYIKFGILSAV